MDAQHQAQRDLIEDATDQLVASLAGFPEPPPLPPVSLPRTARVNWNLFEANEDTILPLSWEQEVVQEAARALHVRFQQVDTVGSEDEDEEWADEDIEEVLPYVQYYPNPPPYMLVCIVVFGLCRLLKLAPENGKFGRQKPVALFSLALISRQTLLESLPGLSAISPSLYLVKLSGVS
ncbi:hypothetical protein C8Q74DRAFT_1366257 [Fomes fomentarius]|nr:hypothetical protein C8Q74DRAFT_1366257 [Fomes fomentarius]